MRDSFLESIGASVLVAATMLPVSCLPHPAVEENLQPFVAATGSYSMMEPTPEPTPPAGKCSTCGAPVPPGGGRLGDGTVSVPCPECNDEAKATDCEKCGGDGLYEKNGQTYICPCRKCKDGTCKP